MLKAVFDKILVKKTEVRKESVLYVPDNNPKFLTGTVLSVGDKVECALLKEGTKILFKKGLQLEDQDTYMLVLNDVIGVEEN